ncbi:unnamed protein product, partial [Phaeothamnion confervicola]
MSGIALGSDVSEAVVVEMASNDVEEAEHQSRLQRERDLNFWMNAGIIGLVGLAVTLKIATVNLEVSRGWTVWEALLRIPQDNWDAYLETLRSNPIVVKAVTSCSVYSLGDGTAQMYEGRSLAELDRGRLLRSAVAGLMGHGPLSHYWYEVCERIFDVIGWNGFWWTVAPKIAVDQLCWGPIWNGVYVFLIGLLKGDDISKVWETVQSTSLPLLLSGLKLWPLAHVITYGLVPTENRLLWVDTVEILWVTILSKQAAA